MPLCPLPFLALAQRGLDVPAFGDVGLHAVPHRAPARCAFRPRLQAHPTRHPVRTAHGNFYMENRQITGACALGLDKRRNIFGRYLAVQGCGIAQHVFRLYAVQMLYSRADVFEVRNPVGIVHITINRAVRQVVSHTAQALLALPQCPGSRNLTGYILGEDCNPASFTIAPPPRPYLPTQPLSGSTGMLEGILFRSYHFASQAPPVHLFPAPGNAGEDLVMGTP